MSRKHEVVRKDHLFFCDSNSLLPHSLHYPPSCVRSLPPPTPHHCRHEPRKIRHHRDGIHHVERDDVILCGDLACRHLSQKHAVVEIDSDRGTECERTIEGEGRSATRDLYDVPLQQLT